MSSVKLTSMSGEHSGAGVGAAKGLGFATSGEGVAWAGYYGVAFDAGSRNEKPLRTSAALIGEKPLSAASIFRIDSLVAQTSGDLMLECASTSGKPEGFVLSLSISATMFLISILIALRSATRVSALISTGAVAWLIVYSSGLASTA